MFHEKCVLCERELMQGQLVLRRQENNKVLCILCVVDIAEVK